MSSEQQQAPARSLLGKLQSGLDFLDGASLICFLWGVGGERMWLGVGCGGLELEGGARVCVCSCQASSPSIPPHYHRS